MMTAPVKRRAVVVDMVDALEAKVRADLTKRGRNGDEFDQIRARQALIALAHVRRKLGGRKEPAR
jgi:hypothetical protein